MTSLVVVNAGLGEPSSTRLLADRLTASTVRQLESAGCRVEVQVIDLRDLAVELSRSLIGAFPIGAVREAVDRVVGADAVIAATPVFNSSYSGLFKMFFDVVAQDGLIGTPVLIAATGGSPRHAMVLDHAMRPLFGYLRTVVVPTGVYAASEDWSGVGGDVTPLRDRVDRAAGELTALLIGARERARLRVVPDPEAPSGRAGGDPDTTAAERDGIATFARLLGEQA
ncbi:FMN reductase [Williamsia sterculiae]|uniref:FMN reductase n=1 Tax=Williamsia sterculiae TaxID=1344003 RepID=A0A1N7GRQ6_9NOCA|nr:FMN reductase [Williamsia sterculiae]SIS15239.1 FMN reductase [Williamsia sterculiae]